MSSSETLRHKSIARIHGSVRGAATPDRSVVTKQ